MQFQQLFSPNKLTFRHADFDQGLLFPVIGVIASGILIAKKVQNRGFEITTAYKMHPQSSCWKCEAELPVGTEFKIVKDQWIDGTATSTDGVAWETGPNHRVDGGQTIANLYPEG